MTRAAPAVDARLSAAQALDAEADQDWWLIDALTERCATKRAKARALRDEVQAEREVAEIAADADRELERRGPRRVRRAA